MNNYDFHVLNYLNTNKKQNQRVIAEQLNLSLGVTNRSIQTLKAEGFLTEDLSLTEKSYTFLNEHKPQNAIILAAGYGLRMVPINQVKPKALLEIDGKPLIERLIEQLMEKNITDITIVVGYMKEAFDYLIDKYSVKLVYNENYATKNNLHSLNCVSSKISDTYIIPCDLWCNSNPFNSTELNSWYMVNEVFDENSNVRVTRTMELECSKKLYGGNTMLGIAYISNIDAEIIKKKLKEFDVLSAYDNCFWEEVLSFISVYANVVKATEVVEINSYEQLRELDSYSKELQNESINVICDVLKCKNEDIVNIETLKKGMTNRSYIFTVNEKKYIMRIPGEGTEHLINRKQEADVYNAIKDKNICDQLFYINPENGMKISSFVENSRCCDPYDVSDLSKCMKKLKQFHDYKIKVDHTFDIFKQIDFYESLWSQPSIFSDYSKTKKNILELKEFINKLDAEYYLTHIDAVPDNFLFSKKDGVENIQLIDWEYAGMQDPHVDIAMFCIYSLYDKKKYIDQLIDLYFENNCTSENRAKIYCYIAMCGLLWSNWCEYKRQLGVELGEYSIKQYRYAKDYYKIAIEEINKLGGC